MQMSTTGPRKSDKYIPWYFVAFFVVLFILDGIFVYLATSSHTGVVEKSTYSRGLKYNETVAAADSQAQLGWKSTINFDPDAMLKFTLADANGKPLEGATVRAQFFRPTQEGQDFIVTLNATKLGSGTSGGLYSAQVDAAPGLWDVRIFVKWQQQRYQMTERIIVPKG